MYLRKTKTCITQVFVLIELIMLTMRQSFLKILTLIFLLVSWVYPKLVLADDLKIKDNANVCEQLNREEDGWLDDVHTYLSIQFCEPSVWFDSFFSDERMDEEVRAGTRVRWQHDYVLTEGGNWEYVTEVRASVKLPKAKKSINLVFEGNEEEDLQDIVPQTEDEVKGDFGLLYEITESERANFSVRVKLSPSILFRYRYKYPFSKTFSTRYTQEWYRRDNADGTSSRIDFEKILTNDYLLRQSNTVTHSESFQGKQWLSRLVLYKQLTDNSAFSYESSVTGVTEPETFTTNTRLGVRYRKNFYRKWLFYEVAPAMNWNKPLITDERIPAWEVLFRLEINFVNF